MHFSMEGIPDTQAAIKAGASGFWLGNMTNAELHYIATHPKIVLKTWFYDAKGSVIA